MLCDMGFSYWSMTESINSEIERRNWTDRSKSVYSFEMLIILGCSNYPIKLLQDIVGWITHLVSTSVATLMANRSKCRLLHACMHAWTHRTNKRRERKPPGFLVQMEDRLANNPWFQKRERQESEREHLTVSIEKMISWNLWHALPAPVTRWQ